MKSSTDPRHKKRIQIVKELFADTFASQEKMQEETLEIIKMKDVLDKKIEESAPAWPIDKLNKIDLAILRLAIYELEKNEAPPKVIIDEAVEIAKSFGSENSPSFVNGVLGTIYKVKE